MKLLQDIRVAWALVILIYMPALVWVLWSEAAGITSDPLMRLVQVVTTLVPQLIGCVLAGMLLAAIISFSGRWSFVLAGSVAGLAVAYSLWHAGESVLGLLSQHDMVKHLLLLPFSLLLGALLYLTFDRKGAA